MPTVLQLRAQPSGSIEADSIRPDQLAGLDSAAIARLPVWAGNRREELGTFFDILAVSDDVVVELHGNLSRVHRLGQGMVSGLLRVEGNVGGYLGARMAGGRIEVAGDVGHCAGQGMVGGFMRIEGSAGHFLGGAEPGHALGMREGVILVGGDAGDDVGLAMRRGLIAIAGAAGNRLGRGMVAGTILVAGGVGCDLGLGMKRGSIVLLRHREMNAAPAFRFACRLQPTFLPLYLRQLEAWGFSLGLPVGLEFERYNGDVLELGKGELLVASHI